MIPKSEYRFSDRIMRQEAMRQEAMRQEAMREDKKA